MAAFLYSTGTVTPTSLAREQKMYFLPSKVHCKYEKKSICQFPLLLTKENEVEVRIDEKVVDPSLPSTMIRKWYWDKDLMTSASSTTPLT